LLWAAKFSMLGAERFANMARDMPSMGLPRSSTAAGQARTSVLITGFGPFPGVPVNATMRLVPELAEAAPRFFPGTRIAAAVLATEWLAAPRRLDSLLAEIAPDLVLHFGVSSRARGFEVEARARNACTQTADAAGAPPPGPAVREGTADVLHASLPVAHIVARLRQRGIPAFVSRDAGGYLCNATLYHSLLCARAAPGRRVGFIHLPVKLDRSGGAGRGRAGSRTLTWEQAHAGGLEILAACLGEVARAGHRR
jgi:pyroglutamyl-peptidase